MSIDNQIYQWSCHYANVYNLPELDKEALEWIIQQLPASLFTASHRVLTARNIRHIKTRIKESNDTDLKKKQRQEAINWLCGYLHTLSEWSVPERQQNWVNDLDSQWIHQLYEYSHNINPLIEAYTQLYEEVISLTRAPDVGFIALQLLLNIAPWPTTHLLQALKHPNNITVTETGVTLKVDHSHSCDPDRETGGVYHLDLITYKLLKVYADNPPKELTEKRLFMQINHVLSQTSSFIEFDSLNDIIKTTQITFYHRHTIPPILLKDLCHPERYVDIPQSMPLPYPLTLFNDLHVVNEPLENESKESKWPHNRLLKMMNSRSKSRKALITWTQEQTFTLSGDDDILPWLLFHYVKHLIMFGGRKKKDLAFNTIDRYASIHSILEHAPLALSVANDEQQLQRWANALYNNSTISSQNKGFLKLFFFFISWQPLTDHLDMTQFTQPSAPKYVDALCLSTDQLDDALTLLLTDPSPNSTTIQKISATCAMILSFFGMLRRKEILHLRCRDVIDLFQDGAHLRLTITHTRSEARHAHSQAKDKTKSGKSRTVFISLPKEYAALISLLLTLKSTANPNSPFIGFENEREYQRAERYLFPITKAMKNICGIQARFHHLRHSGAQLFMLQLLHLPYPLDNKYWYYSATTRTYLAPEFLARRFHYWLAGRPFTEVNSSCLFDLLTEAIGHEHYTTTRRHYLHNIDWLGRLIKQDQHIYSHQELRFLYELSSTSTYLYELIKKWHMAPVENNALLTLPQQAQEHLHKKVTKHAVSINNNPITPLLDLPLLRALFKKECPFKHSFFEYLFHLYATHFANKKEGINWCLLSQCWLVLSQQKHTPLKEKQIARINQLFAQVEFHEDHKQCSFCFMLNKKGAQACQTLFSLPERGLFHYQIQTRLHRNKSQTEYEKWHANAFFHPYTSSIKTISSGKSTVTVTLSLSISPDSALPILLNALQNYYSKKQ